MGAIFSTWRQSTKCSSIESKCHQETQKHEDGADNRKARLVGFEPAAATPNARKNQGENQSRQKPVNFHFGATPPISCPIGARDGPTPFAGIGPELEKSGSKWEVLIFAFFIFAGCRKRRYQFGRVYRNQPPSDLSANGARN